MKRTPNSQPERASKLAPILAFGAHPDDIEFGCGGVIANETQRGRAVHFVVCSRGESASNGTPEQRVKEARKAARILGATIEFAELGGDAHFEHSVKVAIMLAGIIRHVRPAIVLAPTTVQNQHPDHAVLGKLVRDAARLARYAGIGELRRDDEAAAEPSLRQRPRLGGSLALPTNSAHAINLLLFYAVTVEGEDREISPILVDVSNRRTMSIWKRSMEAHATQMKTRNYVELQLTRARLNGLRAGVEDAIVLFPGDPIVVDSVAQLGRGARRY
jgi:N-acetylglucosamine malate deacetylase 1